MNQDWIYEDLGVLISRRRKALEKTQAEVAQLVGMSRASVANIEVGRQKVLVHQLYALASALQLAPADLLPPTRSRLERTDAAVKLPEGLNKVQQSQIARFFEDTPVENSKEGGRNAKSNKR